MKDGYFWRRLILVVVFGSWALGAGVAAYGDDFKGLIVGRTGDAIILKTADQNRLTITLTD